MTQTTSKSTVGKVFRNTPEDVNELEALPAGTLAVSQRGGIWRRNTAGWSNVYVAPGEPVARAVGAVHMVRGRAVKVVSDGGSW